MVRHNARHVVGAVSSSAGTAAPSPERLHWRLLKDGRVAEATIRTLPHGDEIRITVGDQFLPSSFFRADPDGLEAFSTGIKQTFEHKGWTP